MRNSKTTGLYRVKFQPRRSYHLLMVDLNVRARQRYNFIFRRDKRTVETDQRLTRWQFRACRSARLSRIKALRMAPRHVRTRWLKLQRKLSAPSCRSFRWRQERVKILTPCIHDFKKENHLRRSETLFFFYLRLFYKLYPRQTITNNIMISIRLVSQVYSKNKNIIFKNFRQFYGFWMKFRKYLQNKRSFFSKPIRFERPISCRLLGTPPVLATFESLRLWSQPVDFNDREQL